MVNWKFLCAAAVAMAAWAAGWTDRHEYDLVLTIRAEASPQKRVKLLDEWKAKYPKTEQRQARYELYLAAYESMGDSPKMFGVAREMLADQPGNPVGLYWCTLLAPEVKDASPEVLNAAEKAARQWLAGRPAGMADEAWQKQKAGVELLAHRALGWIAWQRGDYGGAEQEFTKSLQQRPKDGEISAWFGIVLALEKQPEKQGAAFWHLARAAALKDEGALPDAQQRQMGNTLERLYTAYHGDAGGLDQLRAAAAESAFPPANFKVESAVDIAEGKAAEELKRTNPELAAWLEIRKKLEAPDGDAYFATLHGTALPKLKGTLVRFSPARRPKELVLALSNPAAEEVVIKLTTALATEAGPGTPVEFEATADAFSRTPFTLTVVADPENISGWPDARARRK